MEHLEKNVAIARSGIQSYLKRELPGLKVGPIPSHHKDLKIFSVYRSAPLIADSKDLFTKKPFIYTHKAYINPENYTKHAQGWIGDVATVEMNEAKTEAVVRAEVNIFGAEAMAAYQDGEREVSPLYFGKFEWKDGVSPDGKPYQIEMTSLSGVNHIALVPAGRGGPDAAILDHLEDEPGFLTGLWRYIKRFVGGVKDELPETFRTKLTEIAKARESYTADQITEAAKLLWDCIADIPETDDKMLLMRYLGDIKGLVDADEKESETYVKLVSDLYEKVDSESLKQITDAQETDMGKSKDEEAKEEKDKEEKEAMSKDADKEWEDLDKKIKDHRAGGGKASDWAMGKSKDEEPDEEPDEEAKKKAEEAEKKKKEEAASKDAEAEELKKKEEEEKAKKEKEAKSEDAAAVYDASPWNMPLGPRGQQGADPAAGLLGKMGYGPSKEKK